MKLILLTIAANLVSLTAIAFAGYLALHDIAGWGWFLFIGACCMTSIKASSNSNDLEDE
jgi:hypothetical protein